MLDWGLEDALQCVLDHLPPLALGRLAACSSRLRDVVRRGMLQPLEQLRGVMRSPPGALRNWRFVRLGAGTSASGCGMGGFATHLSSAHAASCEQLLYRATNLQAISIAGRCPVPILRRICVSATCARNYRFCTGTLRSEAAVHAALEVIAQLPLGKGRGVGLGFLHALETERVLELAMGRIVKLASLRRLTLRGAALTVSQFTALVRAAADAYLPLLQDLSLQSCGLTDQHIVEADAGGERTLARACSRLSRLFLRDNDFASEEASTLLVESCGGLGVADSSALRCLSLSASLDTPSVAPHAWRMLFAGARRLRFLDLSHTNMSDDSAVHLARAARTGSRLECLDLEGNDITQVGARAVFAALRASASLLSQLNLSCNQMSTLGIAERHICFPNAFAGLERLDLSQNMLGSCAVRQLAMCTNPHSCRYVCISFAYNILCDLSVKYVCDIIRKAPLLKMLNLQGNHMGTLGSFLSLQAALNEWAATPQRQLLLAENNFDPMLCRASTCTKHSIVLVDEDEEDECDLDMWLL